MSEEEFRCDCGSCEDCDVCYKTGYYPFEIKKLYAKGVEDAIAIILERGKKVRGAIQPELTIKEIRKRLLNA